MAINQQKSGIEPVPSLEGDEGGSLAETAYKMLKQDIISGVRAPNERLRIERLKQIYGIGPTPLREAMQRLAVDGLVLVENNRGFTVAPLDANEFLDLNTARTTLETQALRLSIENGDAEWESRVVGAAYRLRKVDALLKSDEDGALDEWAAANANFHHAIISACGSRWLLKLRETLNAQYERYLRASVALKRHDRDLEAEHQAILEAVLERDTNTACDLLTEHFNATTRTLIGELSA